VLPTVEAVEASLDCSNALVEFRVRGRLPLAAECGPFGADFVTNPK